MELNEFLSQALPKRVWNFEKAYELKGKTLKLVSSQGEESCKILKIEVESRSTFRRAVFFLDGKFKFELVAVSCNEPQVFLEDKIFEGQVFVLD